MTVQTTRQAPDRSRVTRLVWGAILLVGGVLLLLQSLAVLADTPWVWAVAFGLTGVALLVPFATRPEAWWTAIPAGAALGIGAVGLLEQVGPAGTAGEDASGAAFLALTGLGFAAVWARDRRRWWALIPAGVLVTLAATVLADRWLGEEPAAAAMFLGLGVTFLLLSLLPTGAGRMLWPLLPGAALALFGVLFAVGAGEVVEALNYVYPVAAIGVGAWLLWRSRGHGRPPAR